MNNIIIEGFEVKDIRFPTSQNLDGSDAMNPDPDYSAAYLILKTNTAFEGHGLTFTIGRGNDLCVEAIRQLAMHVADKPFSEDRKSTRLNSSHVAISYAVFCLKKKKKITQ